VESTKFATVFFVACGILSVLFQPRIYINDEIVQAASLDGLARGHVWISGDLPRFAEVINPGEYTTVRGHWAIPAPGQRGPPIASLMVSTLALPLLGLEQALEQLVGVRVAVTLPAALLACLGSTRLAGRFGARQLTQRIVLAATVALFLPVGGLWTRSDLSLQPTLEYGAQNLVSVLATGLATALVFDLVRRLAGEQAGLVCAAIFLSTPVWFWAETGKYSSLSVALVALAIWAFERGARGQPLQTAIAFVAVGLAVWNQLPFGVFLFGAVSISALVSVRRGTAMRHVGAAVGGLVVGLLPDILFRIALNRARSASEYVLAGSGGSGIVGALFQPGGFLGHSVIFDPTGPLDALYRGLAWTSWRQDHYALAMLATVPIAGTLAVLPFLRSPGAKLPGPFLVMGATYGALVFLVMGREFLNIGGGPDMRYGLTFWPFVAVGVAPLVAELCARLGASQVLGLAGFGALSAFLLTLAVDLGAHAAHHNVTPQGIFYDQTIVVRCVGPVLALVLAVTVSVPAWRHSRAFQWLASGALGVGWVGTALIYFLQSEGGPFVSWTGPPIAKALAWILFRHIRGFAV